MYMYALICRKKKYIHLLQFYLHVHVLESKNCNFQSPLIFPMLATIKVWWFVTACFYLP